MFDWTRVVQTGFYGMLLGLGFGLIYGSWQSFLRTRKCPQCGKSFLGIKGKPTLRLKLGAGFVCPHCGAQFSEIVKAVRR